MYCYHIIVIKNDTFNNNKNKKLHVREVQNRDLTDSGFVGPPLRGAESCFRYIFLAQTL